MSAIDVQQSDASHVVNAQREPFGADLIAGLRAWRLWTMLGWNDIRQRYRRSVLGPFWITLSVSIFILVLSFIYSRIFKVELSTYMPFLALGYVLWGFISTTVIESCGTFIEGERIIKQIRLPYSMYVFRAVWRNFLVLLHTIGIYIPIALIFSVHPGFGILLMIPGLILLYINLVWVSVVLSILCARYRDLVQIITTAVQIMLFATPIMWPIEALGPSRIIADVNPLYHILDVVRGPLLGHHPEALSWIVSAGLAVGGCIVSLLLLRRTVRRIVFWL
jgi:ABC-type polysaccharide/polyol phosphate export permease